MTYNSISSVPPGPSLNFEISTEGPRTLTFSWEPPAEDKRNGIITHYLLLCDPQSVASLPRAFNESDFNQMEGVYPVTLSGFTPFTTYNCSVIASNSAGDGPPVTTTATTEEDCKHCRLVPALHFFHLYKFSMCVYL